MKLVKISIADRLFMKICDLFRSFIGKKAIVESYLYPTQISDRMKMHEFLNTGINRIMLKSSYDKNWYTVDRNEKRLLKADNELADLLDVIDYRRQQLSQMNRKEPQKRPVGIKRPTPPPAPPMPSNNGILRYNGILCYESRKAGLGFPTCCKNLNCDVERKNKPIHKCEMVWLGDAWVENQQHNGKGEPCCCPIVPTEENMKEIMEIIG